MYLIIAARLLRGRKSERILAEEIVDALCVLAETYGDETLQHSLSRPVACLEAASRSQSLAIEAQQYGYPSLGAFIGGEVEEEILESTQVSEQRPIFWRNDTEKDANDQAGREYPTYREFKRASLLAAKLGRVDLTWSLGQLVSGALKSANRLPSSKVGSSDLHRDKLAITLLTAVREVERTRPSPSLRDLKRELEGILWGADRDG